MTKRYMLVPIASVLLNFSILTAQNWTEMSGRVGSYVTRLDGERLTCGLATQEEMASIREALDRMPPRTPPSGKYALAPPAVNISVNYRGFTPEARTAFQRAVDVWSALLITEVPIEIDASFGEIESLAHAGPLGLFLFQDGGIESVFPVGLANQLSGKDLDPDESDIGITMSDSEDWYYGLDGNPGEDQFDFVSVVLHEIGHGLGFFDSFRDEEDGTAGYGFEVSERDTGERFPAFFDRFIWDTDINRLVDESSYSNPSSELVEAITGIKLFWYGLEAAEANGGKDNFILLWAPEEFTTSSVAHLDFHAYPPGTPNALMNPFQSKGEASHETGPLLLAMLSDMGWTIREQTLQIPHFGAGNGLGSDVVITNLSSTETATVAVDAWDEAGGEMDGILLFGDNWFRLPPLGSRTLAADESTYRTGSVTISSDVPVSTVVRFDIRGVGIAGVGTSPELRDAIAPVRRIGNLSTGVAVRNVELSAQTVELDLKDEGGNTVLGGRSSRRIEAGGRIAEFIEQLFPEADTTFFRGEVSVRAQAGRVAVMALELDTNGVFTTLPVSPIE